MVFDSEIRDAFAGIQHPWGGECLGWTNIKARAARTAVFGPLWRIERQWDVGIDFTEKEPRARLVVDQHRVFANPAEPSVLRQRPLHDWRAVNKCSVASFAQLVVYSLGQFGQTPAHHFVIVTAQGIPRDISLFSIGQHRFRRLTRRQIIHPRADHGTGARDQRLGATAFVPVTCHPSHLAVVARVEPLVEMIAVLAKVDPGESQCLKTKLRSPMPDSGQEVSGALIGRASVKT